MNVKGIVMDGNGGGAAAGDTSWVVKDDDNNCESIISIISEDDSMCSSSTSSELAEDASSSSTSSYLSTSASSSHSSNGPLYELSDLMNHLPIKRGLSMFYEGKTESFTCLGRVQSIEDLPKKESPYRKRMKSCKSYEGGLDRSHRVVSSYYSPKATISKKGASSRGTSASSLVTTTRGSFLGGTRPSISVHKNYF